MKILKRLVHSILKPIIIILRPISNVIKFKYMYELFFWKRRFINDNKMFDNDRYQRLMLAMADEPDGDFLKGKIVADFGCGPRGSLTWAKSASLRIGIDVLADRYADNFTSNIISHQMIYLKSTEKVIPLPSNFIDVMFTLNAIDHVDKFPIMCSEIIRVLKPGGEFIGSFNLEEPFTLWEPQTLNTKIIQDNLLIFLEIKSYRISKQGPDGDEYAPFVKNNLCYEENEKGFLWVRGKKK